MKKSSTLILILTIAVVGSLALMLFPDPEPRQRPVPQPTTNHAVEHIVAVQEYVQMNVSTLSPIKETMGGKFYTTSVEVYAKSGTVLYEDGHNAYVADFTYSIDAAGRPSIVTFKVRP
ncbi:MAG TPA: hypothetical protein VGE35_03685 [Candidatus Paceibacterota bacterium]